MASAASSNNSYRSINLLAKARIRLLDHPALGFLGGHYSQTDPLDSLTTLGPTTNGFRPQASFDFLVPPVPQAGSSKIVFASNREGVMQIYVMNADGTNVTRLTFSGANDDFPRWSPNGTKILFQSDRDHPDTGYMNVYVMNGDGSGVMRLTVDVNDDSFASRSPDGSKIVFQSMRNGVNYQVYSMNANGSSNLFFQFESPRGNRAIRDRVAFILSRAAGKSPRNI